MRRSTYPPRQICGIAVMWAALLLIVVGCSPSQSAVPPTAVPEVQPKINLSISGTSIAMSAIIAIQPSFEAAQPGYHLDVLVRSGTGSSSGPTVQGVADNKLDIAALSRSLTSEEQALGVASTAVGTMSTAIVTHAGVDVKDLTTKQVQAIFAGTITNWSEVGGSKLPIVVFVRAEDSSPTSVMRKAIFGKTAFTKQSQLIDKSDQLQVALEGTPGGIGYTSWSGSFPKSTGVHSVMLDGVGPTAPSYPISQPLVLCYRNERKAQTQPLIDWMRSDAGLAALKKIGILPAQ